MKTSKRETAVCLVSGGMDSATTLAIARQDYNVAAMHAYYGQLTQDREIKAFRDLVSYYDIKNSMTFSLSHLHQIGGSALTDPDIEVSIEGVRKDTVPSTYVPFRNAHLLSAAVSWAEVLKATRVFIGVVEEDSSGYPDCRQSFIEQFEKAVDEGTLPTTKIKIVAPVLHMSKTEIVKKGHEIGVPYELTWSCYVNTEKACGVCDSCRLRLAAFKNAGYEDPIPYEER